MRDWYHELLQDPKRQKRPIHWYIILTVLGLMGPFSFIGNHSVIVGPILGMGLSVDIGIRIYGWISFGLFFVYPIALLAYYLIAIFCRNFLPLTIAAFFDVLYTSTIVVGIIYTDGFSGGLILLAIGILGNLWFSIYFLSLWRFTRFQRKQHEIT